ncbi:MAG: ABC transporter ATP-binding protein [Deltaproteobacteria bacterium]|jgi:putative ABC transport system ATP-binding protein|nr:ABC transporter ATP-binding protein [Deltaproteobacteria bacterium]
MAVVELKNITKTYRMGKVDVPALSGLNLVIEKGEFLILKGQSGSGKSTTLNIIGCMDIPTAGMVSIAGQSTDQLNDVELSYLRRNHIGFIFQSFNLIPVLNALENVEYPLKLKKTENSREKAREALVQVGLEKFIKHRPNELSGGQIQRVAIARGIVAKPDILLADEPTANLDSKTSDQIMDLMLDLNQNQKLTFIVSTHHTAVMEQASRIVELQDGHII